MFNRTDLSLLILRLGVGLNMLLLHGWQKISGGAELWRQVGTAMPSFGFSSAPVIWGFLAAFAEFGCAILLILGISFRFACFMLAFTMAVAVSHHLQLSPLMPNSGWAGASFPLALLTVYVVLFISGPGKHVLTSKK